MWGLGLESVTWLGIWFAAHSDMLWRTPFSPMSCKGSQGENIEFGSISSRWVSKILDWEPLSYLAYRGPIESQASVSRRLSG